MTYLYQSYTDKRYFLVQFFFFFFYIQHTMRSRQQPFRLCFASEFVRMNSHKLLQQSEVDTSAPLNRSGDIPLPFLRHWRGLIPPVSLHPCTTIAMRNMSRKSGKQPSLWLETKKKSWLTELWMMMMKIAKGEVDKWLKDSDSWRWEYNVCSFV